VSTLEFQAAETTIIQSFVNDSIQSQIGLEDGFHLPQRLIFKISILFSLAYSKDLITA
jgi:hypothetical protein